MPTAGTQFSRYKIPDELDPSGICCISVPVPNDREWIAQFNGAVYRMSIQSHYERDAAHSGTIVAARWREVWRAIQVGCCDQSSANINIQIQQQMVNNMQMAFTWTQVWITGTQTVSNDYYAIPDTYSTDAGDAGDDVFRREQALCLAVQGWIAEVTNYMQSWLIGNFDEISVVAGGVLTGAAAISGFVMWPILFGFVAAGIIAEDAFWELRSQVYRDYLVCRMLANLEGKNPDIRADFEQALDADTIGRPTPQSPTQDIARDLIETYIRAQLNNLDNYLMFAGQLGTAMDIARSDAIECPCLEVLLEDEPTFPYTSPSIIENLGGGKWRITAGTFDNPNPSDGYQVRRVGGGCFSVENIALVGGSMSRTSWTPCGGAPQFTDNPVPLNKANVERYTNQDVGQTDGLIVEFDAVEP